jgi:hypothetical protein
MKAENLSVLELQSRLQNIWRKHEKLCRQAMGEYLYWLRKKMRAQGARNDKKDKPVGFGAWCEENLHITRRTADKWADDWASAQGLKKPSEKELKTFRKDSRSDESNSNEDGTIVVSYQMTLTKEEEKTWLAALRILGPRAQKIVLDAVVNAVRTPKKPAASVIEDRKRLKVLNQWSNAKAKGAGR